MFLKIQRLNNELIKESEKYFGDSFCDELKKEKLGTYKESLVSRYFIDKNKNNFSSISHKKNLVFIGTNNTKIGVDIEIFKIRDDNLLDKFNNKEYKILGKKDWKNFYILWTAKESIIKFGNLILDNIEQIILTKIIKYFSIEHINNKEIKFQYKDKRYIVYSGINGEIFYSVCY